MKKEAAYRNEDGGSAKETVKNECADGQVERRG